MSINTLLEQCKMSGKLEDLRWPHLDMGLNATDHIKTVEMYRDELVRPSLKALDAKIEAMARSAEPADIFGHGDFTALRQSIIEGYLLTTQSTWERGLRGLMIDATRQLGKPSKTMDAIKCATWAAKDNSIQRHFEDLFYAPLDQFGAADDLDILQGMGNALRHGDGRSAERLHERCPSLWMHWSPPGQVILAGGCEYQVSANAPRHPSFDDITLPISLLEQMMMSVSWFWEDVEFVRCNSFTRKAPSVVAKLQEMRISRENRHDQRLWTRH